MKDKQKNDLLTEYEAFLQEDNATVPVFLSEKTLGRVKTLLNPSPWIVFLKLLGIHIGVGFLSLSVCHQFEMNPFGTDVSLANWFMAMWGHGVCMVFCGVMFVGTSILAAGLLLSVEELRALKRTEFLQTLALGTTSLAVFGFFGAELAFTFAGLWLLGALIGGFVATEVAFKLREAAV
jgi:hypothetical protein